MDERELRPRGAFAKNPAFTPGDSSSRAPTGEGISTSRIDGAAGSAYIVPTWHLQLRGPHREGATRPHRQLEGRTTAQACDRGGWSDGRGRGAGTGGRCGHRGRASSPVRLGRGSA